MMELKKLAIDDVKFTSLRGEEISRSNLVEQMINYYKLKVDEGESKVTDFNEGSEIRNLMESIAVDVYYLMEIENDVLRNCFIDTASNAWLDKIGMHPFIKLERKVGTVARGSVTFSIPSALTSEVMIPVGTGLVGDNGLTYVTDYDVSIGIGETSVDVDVSCATIGSDGNVGAGSITLIDDSFNNINSLTVNNSNPVVDGSDSEDDEAYRQRLLDFVRRDDFGSLSYYKRLCEEVESVHDVVLIDATGYTKKVLVNGNVKPTTDATLLDVLTVLSDLNNTVIGHTFTVGKPTFDEIDLDVEITVKSSMDTNIVKYILQDLFDGGARIEGFEFKGMSINQSISQQELYGLFNVIDNITSVSIESDGSPVTDIDCTENHCLKAGTITVTQTVE